MGTVLNIIGSSGTGVNTAAIREKTEKQEPLKTEAIYSLIFKDLYIDKQEISKSDSEVSYNKVPNNYNQANTFILEPPFNTQNSSGVPQSNRQSVKYPYYVDGDSGNTYGIPYMDSKIESVYNRAPLRGFFTNIVNDEPTNNWKVLTNDKYVVSANYIVDMTSLVGTNKIQI